MCIRDRANFAPEILKAYLHTVEANVTRNEWLSPPVTRSLLTFFQAWYVEHRKLTPVSSPSRSGCSCVRTCAS